MSLQKPFGTIIGVKVEACLIPENSDIKGAIAGFQTLQPWCLFSASEDFGRKITASVVKVGVHLKRQAPDWWKLTVADEAGHWC